MAKYYSFVGKSAEVSTLPDRIIAKAKAEGYRINCFFSPYGGDLELVVNDKRPHVNLLSHQSKKVVQVCMYEYLKCVDVYVYINIK